MQQVRHAVPGLARLFDSLPVWENVAFGLIQGRGMERAARRKRHRRRETRRGRPGRRGRRAAPGRTVGRHAEARGLGPRHRGRARNHLLRRADHRPRPDHGRRHQRPHRQMRAAISAPPRFSITHDMASARKIADRIAMLYKGKIIWSGADGRDRPFRQSLCRPVHPRPRRRPDPDGGPRAVSAGATDHGPRPARYVCQSCGAVHPKWGGQVRGLRRLEHARRGSGAHAARRGWAAARRKLSFVGLEGAHEAPPRRVSGHRRVRPRLRRRAGAGLGAAGRRRSRHRQIDVAAAGRCRAGAGKGGRSRAYVSGEESLDQVRLRAARLGVKRAPVELAAATSVRDIAGALDRADAPHFVVVDSIQTMYLDTLDSAPGTVAQVRASAQELIRARQARGFTLMLVGHVTKEGSSPGRACSSTWSTPCSISRASAAISSASCARSRTASARPTRSACSR